jgi:acetyl-CoA/propionyl-CoA carboxylase carboxyl transferase subunit
VADSWILHKKKLAATPEDDREALHEQLTEEHTRSKLTQALAEALQRRGRHKNIPL